MPGVPPPRSAPAPFAAGSHLVKSVTTALQRQNPIPRLCTAPAGVFFPRFRPTDMSMFATAAQLAPLAADTDTAAGAATANFLPPILILLMCVVAGVGTAMLLPSRRETPLRKIGGVVVLAAALIFTALLVHAAARVQGGSGLSLYFWIFSAVALGGALRVVTHTRPVYSALYFVLTVFATAGLFILLWAEFMAAALVLIYAGAILITYVFVIMLASSAARSRGPAPRRNWTTTEAPTAVETATP